MKISYLREDLLSITGNYKVALLLDYLLRECDYDEDRWVCLSLDAISEGSQLWASTAVICRYMGELINKGFVEEHGRRRRVLVSNVRKTLERAGYKLVRV